jgi:hypothetical protein
VGDQRRRGSRARLHAAARAEAPDAVRIVAGLRGRVEMRTELVIRFDYGRVVPWVRRLDGDTRLAIAGPDALCLRTPVEVGGEDMKTVGRFTVPEGRRVPFVLTYDPSFGAPPAKVDAERALADTKEFWRAGSAVAATRAPRTNSCTARSSS